jgi:hypothetical protein
VALPLSDHADHPELLETVERRLPQSPRYRQKVREVTLGIARPVWIDDPDFDLNFHVRHIGLAPPGGADQLAEQVARIALPDVRLARD